MGLSRKRKTEKRKPIKSSSSKSSSSTSSSSTSSSNRNRNADNAINVTKTRNGDKMSMLNKLQSINFDFSIYDSANAAIQNLRNIMDAVIEGITLRDDQKVEMVIEFSPADAEITHDKFIVQNNIRNKNKNTTRENFQLFQHKGGIPRPVSEHHIMLLRYLCHIPWRRLVLCSSIFGTNFRHACLELNKTIRRDFLAKCKLIMTPESKPCGLYMSIKSTIQANLRNATYVEDLLVGTLKRVFEHARCDTLPFAAYKFQINARNKTIKIGHRKADGKLTQTGVKLIRVVKLGNLSLNNDSILTK